MPDVTKYCRSDRVVRTLSSYIGFRCGFCRTDKALTKNILQDAYAIVYIMTGNGYYIDHLGRRYPLKPGSLMQRFPGKRHSVFYEGVNTCFMAGPSQIYEMLKLARVIDDKVPVLDIGLKISFIEKYQRLFDEMREQTETRLGETLLLMQQSMLELLTAGKIDDRNETIIEKTCEILGQNHRHRLNLPEIAEDLNVGYSKLRKLFKRKTGMSMGEYRIKRCMETAQVMLSGQNIMVSDIAEKLGFPDLQSFSKQFKKHCGKTPRALQAESGSDY